jgi:streptomycin 6-kinase
LRGESPPSRGARGLDRRAEVLLHGDLHHDNLLAAERAPWLAIDPKGVLGEPVWEIAPFLYNRLRPRPEAEWGRLIRRRAERLAELLGLDRRRVFACAAVRSALSAWWMLEEGGVLEREARPALVCTDELGRG